MAGSGIEWVDAVFNACVHALVALARLFGLTYEELNVYGLIVLSILLPIMGLTIIGLAWSHRRLRRQINRS